jgi:hypothetical protein
MQGLIESFNLPFDSFRSFVTEHRLIVTGNAATSGYFRQEDLPPYPKEGEMFIWSSPTKEQILLDFLERNNYQVISSVLFADLIFNGGIPLSWYTKEYRLFNRINVENVDFDSIIIVRVSQDDDPLAMIDSIRRTDTDSLTSWWISETDRFETAHPLLTKAMKVFLHNRVEYVWLNRPMNSVEFYQMIGFTLVDKEKDDEVIEERCRPLSSEDDRKELSSDEEPFEDPFDGKKAFDLIAYDDVVIADFLRESKWHMVLQVGETFYAFHRKTLDRMMREHSMMTYSGVILIDTPYRQTITNDVLDVLCYSDYSVMELIHEYDVSINDKEKSMYRVTFSTIAQWRVGDIGYLSRPPPKDEIQPVNRQMWEINNNENEEPENLAVQQFIEAISHIDEDIENVANVEANIQNIQNIQFIVDRQLIDQQLDEDEYVDDEDVIEQYIFMSQFE